MSAWVLLLRGINVGGKGKLPMANLRALLDTLGAQNVTTYIQSGNAVFTGEIDPADFAPRLEAAIETHHGFRPSALVLSGARFRQIADAFPWPEAWETPAQGHIWFLASPPDRPDLAALEDLASPSERFTLTQQALYLHAPDGIGRSKLAAKAERLIGVPATARNLGSVSKLIALCAALPGRP
ncbi:MAG TPA: DUF1697 domain-containing protein [Rhodobacterales bacterium]|nr:DUF1697 domain-containing protein [Rhodobacterales bacterium]